MENIRIYVASSWKNREECIELAKRLRKEGFEVDCFCDPSSGRYCFDLFEILGEKAFELDAKTALNHPKVKEKFNAAFAEDKKWLDWANVLVLYIPSGFSSHMEAGYIKGQGKLVYIHGTLRKSCWENMYQFADGIYRLNELQELIDELRRQKEKLQEREWQ